MADQRLQVGGDWFFLGVGPGRRLVHLRVDDPHPRPPAVLDEEFDYSGGVKAIRREQLDELVTHRWRGILRQRGVESFAAVEDDIRTLLMD